MIRVYHNSKFLKYMFDKDSLKEAAMKLAAVVETFDLDEAYKLTNNIDTPWPANEGVEATGLSLRSTSVGDVLVKGMTYYVVESEGYRELTDTEACSLKDTTHEHIKM